MDKGKNRNDLLAAGRKKLQQYRKKKDHKGSGSSNNSGNTKQKVSEKRTDLDAPVSEQSNSNLASNDEIKEKLEGDSGEISVNSEQPSSHLDSNDEIGEKLEGDSGEISVNSDQPSSNLPLDNEIKEKLGDESGQILVNSGQPSSNLALDSEIREKSEFDSGEVLVNLTTDVQNSGSDLGTEKQGAETEVISTSLDQGEVSHLASENETLEEEKKDQQDASVDQEIANSGFENQIHEVIVTDSNSNSNLNSEQAGVKTDRDFNNPDQKPDLTEENPIELISHEEKISCEREIPVESLEIIKKELYLSAISKDSIELQLDEQTGLNAEMCKELTQCKSELHETVIAKEKAELQLSGEKEKLEFTLSELSNARSQIEGLERENVSMKEEKEKLERERETQLGRLERESIAMKEEKEKLEKEREIQLEGLERENVSIKEEMEKLEREREIQLEALERENIAIKEEKEKLEREREILSSENSRLCTELSDQKERLVRLESRIKESSTGFERLVQENIFLSTSLDLNKLILIESEEKSNQISPNSRFLNVHMKEVRGILGDFKNSVEKLKSGNSGSFNKKGGITDLIKAFESKSSASDEIPVSEREIPVSEREIPASEREIPEYSLESTVQLAEKLELALTRLELDLISENEGPEKEEHKNAIQEKIEGLSVKFNNYEVRIENLQERFTNTQKESDDESARLLSQLEELQKEVDGRVQNLLEEKDKINVNISDAIVKFNSCTGLSVPAELAHGQSADVSGTLFTLVDFAAQCIENLRVENKTLSEKNESSVGLTRKMHDALQKLVINDLGQESNFADEGEDLKLIFDNYEGLIANVQNSLEGRAALLAKTKDLELGLLRKTKEAEEFSVKCDSLAENLNDFCLIKGELESDLMNKNSILEELYARCVALSEKLPENSEITSGDNTESDLLNSILPQLEASISSLLEREKEGVLEIDLAKKCLYDANILSEISPDKWALPLPVLLNTHLLPQFSEIVEKMDVLSASNIQSQTEIELLTNSLNEMEVSIHKSQTELKNKIAELDLSEQRLASVKEKLGIAVTKGKGLIVQRDGLKQNLLEISSELERCKEKLKSSTVERIEALESECSYIRNSANVMRDSFLIRDSVIQRIEEVLEEFEFPEEFYAREIVEKIEFLAHLAVRRNENSREIAGEGNSREIAGEENSREIVREENSNSREIAGEENSNSREIAADENSNSREIAGDENSVQVELRESSDFEARTRSEAEDLKNRYNRLERKFYELAAQNEMLDQSLRERNGLINEWEEFIGRISIIPPQLSDPSERIQWLLSALHDAQTERDSLQSKTESLEESSEMLIVDLEGSRKRISELNAEISGVKSEKEFFSDSLDRLRFDYEVEREGVRKQLAGLRDTISKKIEDENEILRLVDFVGKELNDGGDELANRGSSVQCLDKLVTKLLEERNNYLSAQSHDLSREIDFDEIKALRSELDEALEKNKSLNFDFEGLNEKYEELVKERDELQEQTAALNARVNQFSEERAHSSEKFHQLVTELEKQRNELQDQLKENESALNERIRVLELEREKHLQLGSEQETVAKQRDVLQEQLNQVREKLNVAVRKGKSLVQHRDGLKQQIETLENEKTSLLSQLEASSHSFNGVLSILNSFDLGQDGLSLTDPVQKLQIIGKLNNDLRVKASSAESEASKSRRATDLLLVELNESQERADLLQEEMERIERMQMERMRELNMGIGMLMNSSFEILESLGVKLNKNAELVSYFEAFLRSLGNNEIEGSDSSSFVTTIVKEISSRKRNHAEYNASQQRMDEWNENLTSYIYNCVQELGDLKTSIENEASLADQKCETLFKSMSTAQNQIESVITNLHEEIKKKEKENSVIIEEIKEKENENFAIIEGRTKEFKSSVVQLQMELQEKELQVSRLSAELASQINGLERKVGDLEIEKQSLQLNLTELQDAELAKNELHERVNHYTEMLTKKEQEVESLMQALDEEEKEMEELEAKNKQLEKFLEEKEFALKSLEASRSKTLTKLSTTITKFDELHNLSESLLSEIENLQSQLDSRDSEISFLRQEVTRITNELLSSEDLNKKYISQLNGFSKWVETLVLKLGLSFEESEDFGRVSEYLEVLDRKFGSAVAELDELKVSLQSKDAILQTERGKIVNLTRKCEALESSLSERSIGTSASSSGVLEIEQSREKVMNARGGARKGNNNNMNNNNNGDQVAIAIEMDDDSHNRPLDEDDDKAHGFKALTKSRFVPRFTRPISDRVDGIWVSGDRWLMRHPTLRLGVLIYWIALHAMLASFI